VTVLPAGTLSVTQTLSPITEPPPMTIRLSIVAAREILLPDGRN
jgi:hypothetical protein